MRITLTRLALIVTVVFTASLARASADLGAVSAAFRHTGGQWFVDYEIDVARTSGQATFDGIVAVDRLRSGNTVSVYTGSIEGIGDAAVNCPNTSGSGACGSDSCKVSIGGSEKTGTCGLSGGTCMCKVSSTKSIGLVSPEAGDVYTLVLGVPESVVETDVANHTVAGTF